jgi:hypothetical protein
VGLRKEKEGDLPLIPTADEIVLKKIPLDPKFLRRSRRNRDFDRKSSSTEK